MAKAKTDSASEKIIGLLNGEAEKTRKDFEKQIEHYHKNTLGVHRQKKGKSK